MIWSYILPVRCNRWHDAPLTGSAQNCLWHLPTNCYYMHSGLISSLMAADFSYWWLKDPGIIPARKKREYKKRKHKQATTVVQPTTTTALPVRFQNYVHTGTALHRGRQLSSDDELSVRQMSCNLISSICYSTHILVSYTYYCVWYTLLLFCYILRQHYTCYHNSIWCDSCRPLIGSHTRLII